MKIYIFNSTTTKLLILRMFATILLVFFVIVLGNSWIKVLSELQFFLVFFTLFSIIYITLKKVTMIKVSINFKDYSTIILKRKYILFKEFVTIINLSDIKSYLFENGNGYEVFTIKYGNKRIKLLINNNTNNIKLFNDFFVEFKYQVESYNKKYHLKEIKESPTIYQKALGLIYAYIIGSILILIPIFYIYFQTEINLPLIAVLYPSGLFYIYNVYLARRK